MISYPYKRLMMKRDGRKMGKYFIPWQDFCIVDLCADHQPWISLLHTLPSFCRNLVSQRIIRLKSESRTVSDVLLMQCNYPSHKAGGNFEGCGFVFSCMIPAKKTSLLLQYFNTGKAAWSKLPRCSCGQLVTHNHIIHSVSELTVWW